MENQFSIPRLVLCSENFRQAFKRGTEITEVNWIGTKLNNN